MPLMILLCYADRRDQKSPVVLSVASHLNNHLTIDLATIPAATEIERLVVGDVSFLTSDLIIKTLRSTEVADGKLSQSIIHSNLTPTSFEHGRRRF